MNRKSCENCKDGIVCRSCGAPLFPRPGLLTARDYKLMLALIDGSDRKYAPKTLATVATVFGIEEKNAKAALHRLREKCRHLLRVSERGLPSASDVVDVAADPATAREEIMRRAKAGEISYEQAIELIERL